MLQDLGYTAIKAADSAAGLKVLQSDARIDLLVIDVALPGGMKGRQMADAGGEGRPGLEVLTKPFAIDVLATRIRELVDGWRGGAAALP